MVGRGLRCSLKRPWQFPPAVLAFATVDHGGAGAAPGLRAGSDNCRFVELPYIDSLPDLPSACRTAHLETHVPPEVIARLDTKVQRVRPPSGVEGEPGRRAHSAYPGRAALPGRGVTGGAAWRGHRLGQERPVNPSPGAESIPLALVQKLSAGSKPWRWERRCLNTPVWGRATGTDPLPELPGVLTS